MSLQTSQNQKITTTTYRTMNVTSPEPVTYRTVNVNPSESVSYRTVNMTTPEPVANTVIQAGSVTQLPYAMNGYESVRYLVPVQQAMPQQSYVLMQQPMVQPMVQQVMSPMYVQSLPHLSVSSQESELQCHSTLGVSNHCSEVSLKHDQ